MSVSNIVQSKMEEVITEYVTIAEMVEDALDSDNEEPMTKHLQRNAIRMEESYVDLSKIFKTQYRTGLLVKSLLKHLMR